MNTHARVSQSVSIVALLFLSAALASAQGVLGQDNARANNVPQAVNEQSKFQEPWVPRYMWAGEVALLFGGVVIEPRFDFMSLANGLGGGFGGWAGTGGGGRSSVGASLGGGGGLGGGGFGRGGFGGGQNGGFGGLSNGLSQGGGLGRGGRRGGFGFGG